LSRYHKQMLFAGIGRDGQQQLADSRVLLVGCGALGCVLADTLVRAGVGHLRIVDRDFVELSNLQRQVLFDEQDVADHLPKVIAAERRLTRVNSEITIEPIIADVDWSNISEFTDGMSLILDGTDNFEIRYLINDISLQTGIPWIFTGCTGSVGQVLPVFPNDSGCLRCLMPDPPPPGTTETCDTVGVLGPAVNMVASFQAALALKILTGHADQVDRKLTIIDVWTGSFRQIDVSNLRTTSQCPACHGQERLWLHGSMKSSSTILCGRNAVQVTPPEKLALSLSDVADRLRSSGEVIANPFLVRVMVSESFGEHPIEMTIFPDGRAIIRGTEDPALARTLYSRYIGT
ncbi:MAG: ThiF family adenylyltransferase, partial [Planctomycetota bacterium]|nr:ThiF family adenylyltransferase [Planctomycetota bacterium]